MCMSNMNICLSNMFKFWNKITLYVYILEEDNFAVKSRQDYNQKRGTTEIC